MANIDNLCHDRREDFAKQCYEYIVNIKTEKYPDLWPSYSIIAYLAVDYSQNYTGSARRLLNANVSDVS